MKMPSKVEELQLGRSRGAQLRGTDCRSEACIFSHTKAQRHEGLKGLQQGGEESLVPEEVRTGVGVPLLSGITPHASHGVNPSQDFLATTNWSPASTAGNIKDMRILIPLKSGAPILLRSGAVVWLCQSGRSPMEQGAGSSVAQIGNLLCRRLAIGNRRRSD
jgi:hypothetical protein